MRGTRTPVHNLRLDSHLELADMAFRNRSYEPLPPSDPVLRQQLGSLRSAIVHKPPFCQGLAPLAVDDLVLFYGKGSNAR